MKTNDGKLTSVPVAPLAKSIGVALIARNAGKTIKACIKSFAPFVDQIVVVLAGKSTDNTAKEARKASPKVELFSFDWIDDFAAARNYSFSKLHTDWIFWVDADDEVYQAHNLRKLVDNIAPEIGAIWFPYHYAIDEFGNVFTLYERERLLRASYGWVWRSRLHETVSCLTECKFVRSDEVIIKHNHLAGEARSERNFKLLNIMLGESPEDKRVWLYLGHQNFAGRNWVKAAEWYLKFGQDLGALPIERYQALCYCSKAFREMRDKQAIDVALMAVELYPNYKDGYLELAHSYLMIGDLEKAIHWASISDMKEFIQEPPHVIFINPLDYTCNKYLLLAEAYTRKGEFEKAFPFLLKAKEVRPTPEIGRNIEQLQLLERRKRVVDSIKVLAVDLLNNKELTKMNDLIKSTPFWFRDIDEFYTLKAGTDYYSSLIKDAPEIAEGDNKSVLVNLANAADPEKLLADLDEKYDRVTVVAPLPDVSRGQIRALSQWDMESIIQTKTGRHIIQLQREQNRVICEYDKKIPQELAIRIFLGQGLEYWSPKTIKEQGCGGSETAMALLAKELAAKDCQPIIYAMDTQIWDGVIYRLFSSYKPDSIPSHLFISSRVPELFYDNIPAKQKWLWFHDIHCSNRFTPEVAQSINAIVALSHWQAEHLKRVYPFLKDSELIDLDEQDITYDDLWTGGTFFEDTTIIKPPPVAIIGNAIDITRFENIKVDRIPHRFIWCSSPDRGLEELLTMWSAIRKLWSDATLDIFYGWEYFDSTLFIPAQREFKQRILQLLSQDGVKWCGRVGQQQLAIELAKTDIMLYPPHPFRETYGIAFLEAHAAGVLCFYRQNGALGETIGKRGIPIRMEATQDEIVSILEETLKDPERCGIIRDEGYKFALNRTWAKQADKVLDLYKIIERKG